MADNVRVAATTISDVAAGTDRRVVQRAMWAGLWIWPSFTLLDAYMCFVAYPGAPFALFVAYRVVIELGFLVVYLASRRETTDPQRLFHWQRVSYGATALTIALMAIHLGGIRSPYMHGISIVALVGAALVPLHWRRALPTYSAIGLSFPLVMAIAAAVSPSARAEWMTSEGWIVFGSNYVFVLASATLGVILGHMVWSAQQQARSLGSYQLEGLLGRGGMGEVWSARHLLLARRAAIKLVRPEALGTDAATRQTMLARFEREAQVTASLRSPHTIELYDFGVSDQGTFYYVMELLEGLDAKDLIERFGAIPEDRAIHLLLQVCDSLAEAHASGLVHRDIKPSNMYVCRYGRAVDFVKVLDFGLVKPRDAGAAQLTGEQVVSGTPAFMAPEQVLGEKQADVRSDIYALGCVAYWLVTGQHVFEGANAIQVMMEHVRGTPLAPSQRTELPITPALDRLVLACLEKDPANRPQSADELADALAGLCTNGSWTRERAREWWALHGC